MITRKDLEERFKKETGNYLETEPKQFTEWVEEQFLQLLNDLETMEMFTNDWIQECINEEREDLIDPELIINELYKQNNE